MDEEGVKSKKCVWDLKLNKNIDTAHIHLLSPNAFKNRAPNHLVAEHLKKRTEDLSIKDAATFHL